MTEQQKHLINLVNQRTELGKELEKLKENSLQKQQLFYKVQGAVEYLLNIGVTLPEAEETETETETEAAEKET